MLEQVSAPTKSEIRELLAAIASWHLLTYPGQDCSPEDKWWWNRPEYLDYSGILEPRYLPNGAFLSDGEGPRFLEDPIQDRLEFFAWITRELIREVNRSRLLKTGFPAKNYPLLLGRDIAARREAKSKILNYSQHRYLAKTAAQESKYRTIRIDPNPARVVDRTAGSPRSLADFYPHQCSSEKGTMVVSLNVPSGPAEVETGGIDGIEKLLQLLGLTFQKLAALSPGAADVPGYLEMPNYLEAAFPVEASRSNESDAALLGLAAWTANVVQQPQFLQIAATHLAWPIVVPEEIIQRDFGSAKSQRWLDSYLKEQADAHHSAGIGKRLRVKVPARGQVDALATGVLVRYLSVIFRLRNERWYVSDRARFYQQSVVLTDSLRGKISRWNRNEEPLLAKFGSPKQAIPFWFEGWQERASRLPPLNTASTSARERTRVLDEYFGLIWEMIEGEYLNGPNSSPCNPILAAFGEELPDLRPLARAYATNRVAEELSAHDVTESGNNSTALQQRYSGLKRAFPLVLSVDSDVSQRLKKRVNSGLRSILRRYLDRLVKE